MKLGLTTEAFHPAEDHRWLGSKHAVDTARTITLDASAFEGLEFADGVIPSGIVVSRLESGLYGPGAAGDEPGHLLTTKNTHDFTVDTPAALLWHGAVIVANLPEGHGLHAGNVDALPQFTYRGDIPADPEA
jgi:hypothetical protein